MLNVFNLIEWCLDLLIPVQSRQAEMFVNPRMATLTRDSLALTYAPRGPATDKQAGTENSPASLVARHDMVECGENCW